MKHNIKNFFLVIFSLSALWPVVPQNVNRSNPSSTTSNDGANQTVSTINGSGGAGNNNITAEIMLQLARSSPDYRVTAGDVYTLAYAVGGVPVTYTIPVDHTYRIRVSNLGVIDAAGKTYNQLKTQVESIVANNYPLSGVQLVLTRPAIFRVSINGEVVTAMEKNAWALCRLSELLVDNLTIYASLRDVSVKSLNGQTRVCDVYKATRLGDLSQDPYLRPGDVITVNRVERSVTILGAVKRPGTYQIKEGENLKELIEWYGNGFTLKADTTRIEMIRIKDSVSLSGDKMFISETALAENFPLLDEDEVTIPERTQLQPVMFVEGAVGQINEREAEESADPTVSTRLVVPFDQGEYYASLIRRNQKWFSAVSDTRNAYIIRGDEHIPININPMLYDATYRTEIMIQENDTLIIPFRQYFVTVAGAVIAPGRYPYIPDRNWDYYISLAGGFRAGQNTFQAVSIADMSGRKMKKSDAILPETIITARTNDWLFYFNQFSPVIITALTIVTTALTVQSALSR
jgi:protein involved in polysaccharide export with SLBB domain